MWKHWGWNPKNFLGKCKKIDIQNSSASVNAMKDNSSGLCPLRLSRHCWYFYYLTVFSFHLSAYFTLTFEVLVLKHLFLSFFFSPSDLTLSVIAWYWVLLLWSFLFFTPLELDFAVFVFYSFSLCLVYNNNEHCLSRTDQPRETACFCLLYEMIPKELSKTEPEDTPLLNYLACWSFPLLAILDYSLVIIYWFRA